MKVTQLAGASVIAVSLAVGYFLGSRSEDKTTDLNIVGEASAAGGPVESPTGIAPDRYVYYPGK